LRDEGRPLVSPRQRRVRYLRLIDLPTPMLRRRRPLLVRTYYATLSDTPPFLKNLFRPLNPASKTKRDLPSLSALDLSSYSQSAGSSLRKLHRLCSTRSSPMKRGSAFPPFRPFFVHLGTPPPVGCLSHTTVFTVLSPLRSLIPEIALSTPYR